MRLWFRAAVFWTLLIMLLCWTPRAVVEKAGDETSLFKIPNFDKLVHASMFIGFSFLWLKATAHPRRVLFVILAGFALTVVTELGQLNRFVNRDARLDDGLFDMIGVFLGIAAYRLAARRIEPATPSHPAASETSAS